MKINHNSSNETKVPLNTINTMMEQISNLQEDVSEIQNEIDGLGQSISTVSVDADNAQIDTLNTTNLSSTEATVNTLTASVAVNTAEMSASTSHLGNADAGKVDTEILEADTASIDVGTVTALESVDADITRANIDSLSAGNAEVNTLETNGIANNGDYTGRDISAENVTASNTVNTKDLNVTDTANIKDLNISGHVSGVADITLSELETNELKATDSEIKTIKNEGIYTDNSNPLTPTPGLSSDSDRYTIELPTFDGTLILTWKDGNTVRWTATVIGNGVDYGITFGCTEDQTYITELFQWNRHLYIRHRANGQLVYSYNAEKKIEINTTDIYYNMTGWANPKSLEELTEEDNYYQVVRASGTVWFGKTVIPRLDNGDENNGTFNFKGSRKLSELPTLSESDVGDVWNITNNGYTDNRFVEGAGKPINAGDDVIAVMEVAEGGEPEKDNGDIFDTIDNFYDFTITQDDKILFSCETLDNSAWKNYKGIDGTWEELSGPSFYNDERQEYAKFSCIFKASNGNLIAAPNSNYWQLRYSSDNGETWNDCEGITYMDYPENGNFAENNGRLFYTCWSNELYSDDYGITWQNLPTGEEWTDSCSGGVVLPINNQKIITFGAYEGYISTSNDNGNSWSYYGDVDIRGLFGKPKVTTAVLIDNIIFITASEGSGYDYVAFKSVDYGDTWEAVPALDGYKILNINNELYLLNENGLYKTQDYGTTIETIVELEGIFKVAELGSKLIIGTYTRDEETYEESYSLYYYSLGAIKRIRWNKFAAGVNYENFTAQNITATTSLKLNNNDVLTTANRTDSVVQSSTDVLTSGGAYTALAGKIDTTEKGVSNGVATLDATGRVPYTQLPESAMEYKGTWDASTNTPELKDGTGTNGDFYVVSVAGTVNLGTVANPRNVTFYINDRAIYDGTSSQWARLPAGEVRSVNGMSGDVTLTASDVNALPSSTVIPTVVDTVADGNMNAVTSNAVYDYIDAAITQVLNTGF